MIMSKVTKQPFVYVPATILKLDAEFGTSKHDVQFQVDSSNIGVAFNKINEWILTRKDLNVEFEYMNLINSFIKKDCKVIVIDAKQCDCGQRQGACVTGMGGCMTDKQTEGESA